MDFSIILTGLNHKVAGVDIREKYSLADYTTPQNWAFQNVPGLQESLILSTCNRVEVIGVGKANFHEKLIDSWCELKKGSRRELNPHLYIHSGLNAVKHVFEVASSLDSMVLGEPQILGQFKDAYKKALISKNTGPVLNRLLHTAFFVAKRVRNETSIGVNAVSISYSAVELAKCIFGNLKNQSVLLCGAGEMAELAALHLLQGGIDNLVIINRTLENAEKLARKYNAQADSFDNLANRLASADIVITSTAASSSIVTAELMQRIMRERKNKPVFFIDIAVPRNVEAKVNSLDNVYLYDIDDLREVVEKNRAAREKEALFARGIIEEETLYFDQWLKELQLKPVIMDLLKKSGEAADIEVRKTLKKIGPVTPEVRQAIEKMAHSITARLNHAPLAWLKNSENDVDAMSGRISSIRKIFDLDSSHLYSQGQK